MVEFIVHTPIEIIGDIPDGDGTVVTCLCVELVKADGKVKLIFNRNIQYALVGEAGRNIRILVHAPKERQENWPYAAGDKLTEDQYAIVKRYRDALPE